MSYPCFIERASICRERFQGTLLNPAETTGALTSPLAVPQLAGRKLIWMWLCALVCFQRRKSLTLGVSDLLLLTLLSILLFFSLLGCGFHNEFMLNWRKYHLQMSPQVSYIASPSLPHVKDPEPEWLEGKLNQTDRNIQSFRGAWRQTSPKTWCELRLPTQIQGKARSCTNSTHSLFSPSPLEKKVQHPVAMLQLPVSGWLRFPHSHKKKPTLVSYKNKTGQAELQAASVSQFLQPQPCCSTTTFHFSLYKRTLHGKPQAHEE